MNSLLLKIVSTLSAIAFLMVLATPANAGTRGPVEPIVTEGPKTPVSTH